MNKIFKVVWNRTIGSFVVTSELAKGRVKSSSEGAEGDVRASEEGRLKTLFRLTALSAALLGFSEGAWAVVAPTAAVANGPAGETAVNGGDARGTGAVAVGAYARAGTRTAPPNGMNSGTVAIGGSNGSTAALADGNNAIAIGTNSNSNGAKATTIGSDTIASDQFATALGGRAEAKARGATAIGGWTQATGQFAVAIGGSDIYGRGNNTELNDGSGATLASGDRSTAIGRRAKASGSDTLALGTNAEATASKALAFGQGAQAQAGDTLAFGTNAKATGVDAVAFGTNANASILKSIAIGKNTQATGEASIAIGSDDPVYKEIKATSRQGIAIGTGAKAIGDTQAVAIGPDARAIGNQSTSIGNNTRAEGDSSVAIGGDDWDGVRTKTVAAAGGKQVYQVFKDLTGAEMMADQPRNTWKGTTAGHASVAVGVKALAEGVLSTAFGAAASAQGVGASAFGVGATATHNKSVAIGAGSRTETNATVVTNATINGISHSGFAGAQNITDGSQVSFGSVGYERQLKHVAPGEITATSTDAINGSQLYAIAKDMQAAQTHYYSVNRPGTPVANYNNDGATGENAIAAGPEAKAAASNAVVIGSKATVEAAAGSTPSIHGNTTGSGSVAVGSLSKANGENAVAIGQRSNAYGQNSFAGGQVSNAKGKSSVAVGDGANALNDSAVALGAYTTANNAGATAVGFNSNALGWASFAGGHSAKAEASSAVALGHEAQAVGGKAVAIGKSSHAAKDSGIALGDGAKAAEVNAIAIGSTNNAWKEDSIALGRAANADGAASLALGLNSHTRLENAIALGNGANADHSNSIAIGKSSHAAESAGVAIGNDAQALKYSSVVIGDQAQSNNSRSVVIGYHASATNPAKPASAEDDYNQTVAIGAYANAWGDQSTAIGNNVDAKGNSSIAIGADDWDTVAVKTVEGTGKTVKEVYQDYTGDVMATGKDSYTHTTSGEAAVAIGTKSQAIGELSTAFGTGTIAEGVASAAFGMGAKATKGNSVAIGAGSTTTTNAISVNEATVNNLKYSGFAGGNSVNPGDQVSFGSKNYERQLKNVAPGEISNTSTDAINGSQLYAVQNVLGNTAKTVKDVLGGNAKLAEDGSITMSNIGNTGAGNIHDAINSVKETAEKGWKLKVNEEAGSEKIAPDDTVTVKQGKNIRVKRSSKELTIETADDVAFNKVTVGDSVLGSNGLNITNGANPVSLTKDGLNNGGNKVTNIADGAVDTDAASYKQVKAAKTEVQKGTNVAEVKKTEGTDGQAIYTVNAKGTVVSASGADNGLTLGSSEDTTTNVTTYSLDLSDKTKESLKKADSALQNIGVHVNGTDAKTLNQANSKLNFVDGTGTTAENKADGIAFNVNKSTLKAGTGGTVNAGTSGDAFATATDVANAINKAVADSEKTSIVAAGDNTHVASQVTGNETLYTVHADKTTVSVKADGGKLALNPTEVINSNQTKTTNYELDLTDAAKSEIQKGVDAKTAVDSKGVAFAGNNGTTDAAKLGETVNLKGDDQNVVTEAGADGIKVKLKDEITVQTVNADKLKAGNSVLTTAGLTTPQVTAGDNVLNGDGLKITNGDNPVSLTKSGLNNGGNKITKVAKGENADDAVNYGQLKELADKGLTFDADGNTSTSSKKLGERVGIKGGNNITTSADNDNVTVKLNDDITVTSVTATTLKAGDSTLTTAGLVTPKVTAGNSVLEDNGLTISNGAANAPVSLTKNGLDNGNNKITKVAKGAADTDAANVEQIKPLAAALNTTVGADGTVGQPSFTVKQADGTAGTAVHTVQDALNKVSDELNKGLTIAADNGNADKVNLGETVTYTSKDKNIVTTVGSNEIDFSLANTVTVGKNAADGNPVTIDGTNGTVSGLTNKTLGGTNFAAKGQAATEEQINAAQTNLANVLGTGSTNQNGTVTVTDIGETGKTTVSDAIKSVKETAEKGWNLQANGDTAEKVAAGETVTFKDGKNIKVTRDGKNITVATSNEVAFDKVTVGGSELTGAGLNTPKVTAGDSELNGSGLTISNGTAGSSVSLTKNGLNNGGNKITKVAEGTLAADSTDAVNGAQLYKVDQKANTNAENIAKGINVGGTEGSNKYALGDTVNIKGDSNIVSDTVEGGVQLKLADTVKIGQDTGKPVSIDGTTGTVSGLSNTTLGGTGFATSNKAATEAQLDATQANLKTILGGNAENTNGNIAMSNIGGTNQNTVHDAIKSVKETAEKGWKLKVNEETSAQAEKISPDDEVAIKQGKNITVTRDGKNITVATSDDVAFNKVTVGDSVLNGNGLTIANGAANAPVSLTKNGLDNGGNKASNIAKGTADTDAVNVEQLKPIAVALNTTVNPTTGEVAAPAFTVTKADGTKNTAVGTVQEALDKVGEELKKGLVIAADEGSSEKVNLGDTVTYTSKDKNIVTTSGTGKAIDFSLAEKVTIGKDAANGGKPVVIDGKEGIVSGLSNTTLGAAPLADSNKAATEAQLDATQVNLANVLGGNAANNNGNVTTNNIGGTGENNIHDAIKSVKATADKGWKLKANDEADSDSEKIAAGDTVTVKQGKNIRVKRSGKELTVETEDDVEFGTVSATTVLADSFISGNSVLSGEGLKIGADGSPSQVSLTNAGLNNGGNKIANVAKGTADTDAVNVAQLNEQLAATEKTTTVVAGKNVTVSEKVDGNNTEYTVNADKTTLSQAANGAVKVSEGAKDADGVTDYALDLTDEAKADIAKGVAAKDAVDNKGLTFAADNGTTGAKKLGDSLSVKGDGNILTRADENGIGFSLADKITVGKAGNGNKPLVIDGTAGLISGLSNTTLGGADFATKGQAASEEQLNAAQANLAKILGGNAANDKGNVTTTDIGGTGKDNVHDAIAAVKETADKGWNLNANDETSSEKIGAGDTVTFKEGKNVKVSRNGKNITVATSDDVSFDKVTVGDSVLTDNGLTVGNGKAGKPVSLTKDGLNNGGNKIANVAAGEADTDAVNVAQLKAAAAKATSKVDSGNDNIVVTPEQNADGSTTYKVATAPNLKADSFTAGDTVVNNDGVKVGDKVALGKDGLKAGDVNITADGINAGNKVISNVAAGVKDTDAANVGQLNRLTAAAKTEVEAGTNIASVTGKQGANGQTVYTVNADGASVSAGSDNIVVTKGNKDANNVTDYAVDLSKAVKADIAKGVAAKDAVDNKGISFAGDSGTTVANKLGDTVAVKGDANITTTAGANGIQVGLNKDLKVDSVKAGDTVVNNNGVNVGDKVALGKDGLKAGDVNITADGINAGGKKVTGVAAGTVAAGSTDAVNGGQLHQVYELIGSNGGNVNTAPPSVEADGKAGLGNIKNITLVDNSNNPNVTNVTNETKIAQSNGYSLVTYNVEDQGMYVTNNVIEAVGRMNEQGIKFFHTNDGEVNPDVQARNSEDSSASGAYATAVGFQAASKGTNAIAIGKGAKANAENTIAIGTGNIVSGKNSGAIGDPTVVSGNSSYSIGNNNNVSADNAYALGSNIKATVNDSVYLGDRAQTQGIHTADAAKGEAYTYGGLNDKAVAGKAGSAAAANKVAGVVTVGNGTDETRQVQGVAAGVVSADSTDAINGSQLYYTNQAIANVATQATAAKTEVTAGKNVVVNQTTGNSGQTVYNVATADKLDVASVTAGGVTVNAQGVSIAAPTAHNPANTVSLSPIGLNNGGQRITNVAPAKEGTDAVNLNQLAGVGNALQNNIERVGKKAYAGVAGAIAQGSIPQVTRPGATGIGVGSGYYGGQSAMAIGVSAMSDGGNWVVKGNFSANTDGHVGVGAGALYQW